MLNDYQYELFDLAEISEVEKLFANSELIGLNVTVPFKEKIIPYLDALSEEARHIGAVNCITIADGCKKGYNTDAFGFAKTLELHQKPHQQSALILGDGGAAKAVRYVFEQKGIVPLTVSRKGALNFENLNAEIVSKHQIIVQCTPVGTFPTNDCLDFPFDALSNQHLVIDLIYNPEFTSFLEKAAQKGAQTANGYYMLEQQAEKNWEIWKVQKK